MILKLKAVIYRYTGLYLASKEELEYLTSKTYWKEYKKILRKTKKGFFKDFDLENIQSYLIGSWQVQYGFYRTMDINLSRFGNSNPFLKVVSWIVIFFKTLKYDLESLLYRRSRGRRIKRKTGK